MNAKTNHSAETANSKFQISDFKSGQNSVSSFRPLNIDSISHFQIPCYRMTAPGCRPISFEIRNLKIEILCIFLCASESLWLDFFLLLSP